jgi:hypothetical protein
VTTLFLGLAATCCTPPAADTALPRPAEVGAGFVHPWHLPVAHAEHRDESEWRATHQDWVEQSAHSGRDVERHFVEFTRRSADAGAAPSVAAACLRLGGIDRPADIAEQGAWSRVATDDRTFTGRAADRTASSARTAYVRITAAGTLRLDVALVVAKSESDFAELGRPDLDDASLAALLPVIASLVDDDASRGAADREAEERALAAVLAGDDAAGALRDVVARTRATTAVVARTLGVGSASHVVLVQQRDGGVVLSVRGVGAVRVGRALLVFGVEAEGGDAATIASEIAELAARLAARLTRFGDAT